MKETLVKFKAFLKKYWWLVAGVALVTIWTILARGRGGQLGTWRDIQKRVDKVDAKKTEELQRIEVAREARIVEIEEEYAEEVEAIREEEGENYETLRRNPRALARRFRDRARRRSG
jgi:hypothetical protein